MVSKRESEGKSQLNKIVLSKLLISELNRILTEIAMDNLSFNQFEKYYNVMESLVKNGLTKIASELAIALNTANVIVDDPDKQDKYNVYKEKIEEIVADRARQYLEESEIKAPEVFGYMKKTVQNSGLSFERYCYYVKVLKAAYMAKLEGLDYLEIAKDLQGAAVIGVNTLDDLNIYNSNQSTLSEFIAKLSIKNQKR